MLCSLLPLARRLITHELGAQHSQSPGNNHEYSIIQQWKSASLRRTKVPTKATINHAGRKRADKDRLGKTANAQTQQSGGSRLIKIHSSVTGGGESKKKVSRLADRLFRNEACLVSVNHRVVSVTDWCGCDARCFGFVVGFNVNCYALTVESK